MSKVISLSIEVLQQLIDMSNSHVEDIQSGLDEGMYQSTDNGDLGVKVEAIRLAEAALEKSLAIDAPSTAVVVLKGSLIDQVLADGPLEILIVDRDIQGAEPGELTQIQGISALARFESAAVEPKKAAAYFSDAMAPAM